MQTTDRPTQGPARGGGSPVRGVVLVAVAVVIGFFVLRAIDDTGSGTPTVESQSTGSSDTTAADGGATDSSDTTAAPEPRPPGEVVVMVANASGVGGAAGLQTDAIAAGGYQVAPATNAPEAQETTKVLAVEGYEPEAAALVAQIGAPGDSVAAMPDPPPVDLAGAQLLVLLGSDLAGGG